MSNSRLTVDALAIWHAAVSAVQPVDLIAKAIHSNSVLRAEIARAPRILVVGAGKAGAGMADALETALGEHVEKAEGLVNVPADAVRKLKRIRLHAARPAGSNHPTEEGVKGGEEMLGLLRSAGPDDLAICLISGGGSALLPAPDGLTLKEKQAITKQLHASGATINEMNAVRKHLSRIKGGRLAQEFKGRSLFSLIISDVVGDPLDVIASGPTAPDTSTFADALAVLDRYELRRGAPAVVARLERGLRGEIPETPDSLSSIVHNEIIGNNATALRAASEHAEQLGYRVLNLGSRVEGETRHVAAAIVGIARSIRDDGVPFASPACILLGGETTVSLGENPGKGGRNQEFVLAAIHKLGDDGLRRMAVLSGGTDGEDGPTDAAGAVADQMTFQEIRRLNLAVEESLDRHDAYHVFERVDGLIRTGLTGTNVMDVTLILIK